VTSGSARDWPPSLLVAARFAIFAVACTALYFGQAVLEPLVLAALLTFLLSPLVTRLDRLRVPRVVGVLCVMTLVGAVIGGVGYVVAGQVQSFAAELPMHRQTIRAKIGELAAFTRGGTIETVQETIEDINAAVEEEGDSEQRRRRRDDEPMRVIVQPPTPLLGNTEWLRPLFGVVGTIGLTLLLAIFMLVNREDLRDRLVSISGRPSLVVATKALAEAGTRISRFLLMQFVINATMGVAVGIGLYFIGVPYAALWGLTAGVMRYVPYVGPWVAALLPVTVSLVTAPGWQQFFVVAGMFVVLELLSNNVMEPLLYGHSVGLSSIAVIVAAIFWTWLWGPVGLVIATPITACIVVLSRYVPALDAIGRLLGERPALAPHETLYQRLLARDDDEAGEILRRCCDELSLDDACQLVLDALLALKRDLQAGRVTAEDGGFVIASLRELVIELELADEGASSEDAAKRDLDGVTKRDVLLMGLPGRDPLDALVLELARVLLRGEPVRLEVLPTDLMTGEALAEIAKRGPAAVVVPSLPPAGLTPARHLCMRVHARLPDLPLVAARLGDPEGERKERAAVLETAGCTTVAVSLDALGATLKRVVRAVESGTPVVGTTLAAAVGGG
jgi:predicted PurR-regulated permease PerM